LLFSCKSLCEVVFESHSKLKEIGDSAFPYSRIKTIRIPINVENIGKRCFSWSRCLSEVTFQSSPSIGNQAFYGCPLKYVNVAKGVILNYQFREDCTIREIDLSEKK
jgi:hypothetical protein